MIRNLTIRQRLVAVLILLLLLLAAVGGAGLASLDKSHRALRTVYEEDMAALGKLDGIMRILQRNQTAILRAASGDPAALPAVVATIETERDAASKLWQSYRESLVTAQEREIAAHVEKSRKAFMLDALAPALAAAKAGDIESMRVLVQGPMQHMFPRLRDAMERLLALRQQQAKAKYAQSEANYDRLRQLVLALLAVSIGFAASVGWWLVHGIAVPLQRAVAVAQALARGDLSQHIEVHGNDETGKLLAALKDMGATLAAMAGDMGQASDAIATASAQIASGNLDMSRRSEAQAGALQETSASLAELACAGRQNADNARQANQLAQQASHIATRSGAALFQVIETMGAINANSHRIADIVGLIDGIACQTRLLALDAAATAARAGRRGRGCAAVARAVHGLAQRSADAAKQIRELVAHSVRQAETGNALASQAGVTMHEVVQSVHRASGIINQVTSANHEQSVGIGLAHAAVRRLDAATRQDAAQVQQVATAAAAMLAQAARLAQAAGTFRLGAGAPAPRLAAAAAPYRRRQLLQA